jgi:ADP-ribosylglycohydrolase
VTDPGPAERILGSFLGGAIGDALGAPIEFASLHEIRARHGAAGVTGFTDGVWPAGTITDDTQMTLFTAEGFLRASSQYAARGRADPVLTTYHAYLRWLFTQGRTVSGPEHPGVPRSGWLVTNEVLFAARAPGNTCLSALQSGRRGIVDQPLNDSKGCGAVMRVAPVGLAALVIDDPFTRAVQTSVLTHGHPSGYLSAGFAARLIGAWVRGATVAEGLAVARDRLVEWDDHEETLVAVDAAVAAASEDRGAGSAERVESLGAGWVGEEALAIALYCVLVTGDVREGLLLAVNHGGDSDSTGAIAGNLLGALHGAGALPADLLEGVEARELVVTVADDFIRTFVGEQEPDPVRYPGY